MPAAATLFLSDLHLPPGPSPLRERFLQFLRGPAREAQRVYILGDLFESWVGDDLGLRDYAAEVAELAALGASSVELYFQHGNRDFLVGDDFFSLTGVRPLPDPAVIDLPDGSAALISHGDALCTDDLAYQRWRRFSRKATVRWLFLRLPRAWRERIAGGVRSGSNRAKRYKSADIMDVNADAVSRDLRLAGTRRLVHGHTHRPGRYVVALADGSAAERIVLPDWREDTQDYLRFDPDGWQRLAVVESTA